MAAWGLASRKALFLANAISGLALLYALFLAASYSRLAS